VRYFLFFICITYCTTESICARYSTTPN